MLKPENQKIKIKDKNSQIQTSEDKKNLLRLNKFLSKWAGVSRRRADGLIKNGDIFVNGKRISQLAVFVDPKKDVVKLKKKIIRAHPTQSIYIMFNKPRKVLTTTKDPKGRPLVMDYIKKYKERLFPVGRLDWLSEGLLILTNDGDFSDKVLQPKNKIPKTYLAKVQGRPKDSQIEKLIRGVSTPVGKRKCLFAKKILKKATSSQWVKLIIFEGKKRQIRLMFDSIGFPVIRLRRIAIGRLRLNKLLVGAFVSLPEKERQKIFQMPKEISKTKMKKKETPVFS